MTEHRSENRINWIHDSLGFMYDVRRQISITILFTATFNELYIMLKLLPCLGLNRTFIENYEPLLEFWWMTLENSTFEGRMSFCIRRLGLHEAFCRRYMDDVTLVVEVQSEEAANYNCMVLVIMTHGSEGCVLGTDGKQFDVRTLLEAMKGDNCPALAGRPKLVFIQVREIG